jgi:hypothetical protein
VVRWSGGPSKTPISPTNEYEDDDEDDDEDEDEYEHEHEYH